MHAFVPRNAYQNGVKKSQQRAAGDVIFFF
jgi:hypothetical protein